MTIPSDKIAGATGHIQDHHDIDATLTGHESRLVAAEATVVTHTGTIAAQGTAITAAQGQLSNTRVDIMYDEIGLVWPARSTMATTSQYVNWFGPLGARPTDARRGDDLYEASV